MTTEEQDSIVWGFDTQPGYAGSARLLAACLERLKKADGHINAVERYLWQDKDRGMWSGNQAKARMVETLKLLREAPEDIAVLERYLSRQDMHALLEEFDLFMPDGVIVREMEEAEGAVRENDFLAYGQDGLSPLEREELDNGIKRAYQYRGALFCVLQAVETEVARRFPRVKQGDWVSVRGCRAGYVCGIQGLTLQVFDPSHAGFNCRYAISRHWLIREDARRVACPVPRFMGPEYYSHDHARRERDELRHLIEDGAPPKVQREKLILAMDAMARTWWLIHQPGDYRLGCDCNGLSLVRTLEELPQSEVTGLLCGMAKRIETLSGWSGRAAYTGPNADWCLEFAVMAAALDRMDVAIMKAMQAKRHNS